MHCIASNMEASSGNRTCSEDFSKLKVDELKHYLRERGIQLSDDRKGMRRAELLIILEIAIPLYYRDST